MIATLLLGFICLFINFVTYFEKSGLGLKISFFLIFLFLAVRYEFGNDYIAYLNLYKQVIENSKIVLDPTWFIVFEPGWLILNWLFTPFGFFSLNIALAALYSFVLYRLIDDFVPIQYHWLSVFFIIFNPAFLLVHSTTMRQTVAILLFLLSLRWVIKRNYILYFLTILLAMTFHFTSFILILISPFLFYDREFSWQIKFFIFLFYLIIFILAPYLSSFFNQFAALFSAKYETYADKGVANSGLGFVFYSLLFILVLFYSNIKEKYVQLFFRIASLYFLFMPFSLIIEQTSRFGMYFSISLIIVFPFLFELIQLKVFKYLFLVVIISFSLYQFFQFFYSDTYRDYFMDYKTIFTSSDWE